MKISPKLGVVHRQHAQAYTERGRGAERQRQTAVVAPSRILCQFFLEVESGIEYRINEVFRLSVFDLIHKEPNNGTTGHTQGGNASDRTTQR